jgi:hypothetical protein
MQILSKSLQRGFIPSGQTTSSHHDSGHNKSRSEKLNVKWTSIIPKNIATRIEVPLLGEVYVQKNHRTRCGIVY